jgi:hypothetical protein
MERYFEVRMRNGVITILSEQEVELYRHFIEEVKTELTQNEIASIAPLKKQPLTPKDKKILGIES